MWTRHFAAIAGLALPVLSLQGCLPATDQAGFKFFSQLNKIPDGNHFEKFSQVMKTRCLSCHSAWIGGNLNASEEDWIHLGAQNSRIVPGNLEGSAIYGRATLDDADPARMPPPPREGFSGFPSLTAEEVDAIENWILSLKVAPAPSATPSVTPSPSASPSASPSDSPGLTLFQKFESVVQNNRCLDCHGPNMGYYSWFPNKTSISENDWRDLAYAANGTRIRPGNSAQSDLYQYVLKPTTDPLFMPRGGTPLSAESLSKIKAWIDSLPPDNPDSSEPPPPGEDNPGAPSKSVVRVMDRKAMSQWFISKFGPSIQADVDGNIAGRPERFGGACDPHHSGTVKIGSTITPYCERVKSMDGIILDASAIPDAEIGREAYRTMTCRKALFHPGSSDVKFPALQHALKALSEYRNLQPAAVEGALAANPIPNREQLKRLYKAFMGGRDPSVAALDRLEVLAAEAQGSQIRNVSPATDRRFESYRYVLLALCYGAEAQFY